MERSNTYDIIDGRKVPPLVLDRDHTIDAIHEGSVRVERGVLTVRGTLQGSLAILEGAAAIIAGTVQGSVSVEADAVITVTGAIEGSASIEPGASMLVEASGKLAGSLHNDGLLTVRGVFGGSKSGTGEMRLEGDGYVKEPSKVENGIYYYDW